MNERDLFTAALHHDDPAAYLREACADPALRRRVEALLEAHRLAGAFLEGGPAGDAPASELPPTAGSSVLQALAAGLPAVPRVHLRDPLTEDHTPVSLPGSGELPSSSPDGGDRYQLVGELGRGGMGAVLKGRDTDLGRDVAVKVLLDAHKGKVELIQRFVEEAQVGGQLQHPGIVPVYELGQFPDKRPFFAMKLVKGQTLAKLLRQRPSPADELPRFLGVFAQVCQALAYAHARGVIHRDLKPANVMVGAFGEVQVMDWGLAKVLRQGGAANEPPEEAPTQIRTVRSANSAVGKGSGSDTRAGSVLGTPAYMAPEQANGEVGKLDERADVFGLGAVLCEVLTGQPPYTGRDSEEVYHKAAAGDTAEALAWLGGCGADADLIGLAKHCLAADPLRRPRDAGEVAAAVTQYQESVAERLRQAELARAAEAARAEEAKATATAERRARRLTLGLAAAVLLLVTVGAMGGLWAQRQWAERDAEAARQRQAVEAALDKANELRQQARWAEARAILDQTRHRLGEAGPEDLRQRVGQAAADLALVDRLESIRLNRATLVEGKVDIRPTDRDYAAAFRDAGLGREGDEAEAMATRVRASAVGEQLVAALDDWAAVTGDPKRWPWLLEVARRADPDVWRDRFRDPKVWGDLAALEKLADELLRDEATLAKLKPPLLASLGGALRSAKAVPLLAAAQARHPGDFWLNFNLGRALLKMKRWDEAVGYYRAALAVRPDSSVSHNNLSNALQGKGQVDEAIKEYRAAIALEPKDAKAHTNLGNALRDKGQLDEAIKEYRAAIALDPKDAKAHSNIGTALRDKGQLDEAIKEYRAAIALDPKFAPAHSNIGIALHEKGKLDEAMREYRAAIALDPKDAPAHYNLGNALRDKGQIDEAIKEYRAAIALDPKFAPAHSNIGIALHEKGKLDEAMREYRAAIALDPQYAVAHYNLGNALRDKKQLDGAIAAYRAAIELQPDFAEAHCNLGLLLRSKGQYAEALAALRRGHELGSKRPGWRYPSAAWVRQAERMVALDVLLSKVLKGEEEVSNAAGLLELARFATHDKKMFAATAGLYKDSFRAHPGWADAKVPPQPNGLPFSNRRFAASAAATAAAGAGDGAKGTEEQRAAWRRQALDWLRAELTAWERRLDGATPEVTAALAKLLADTQTDDWLASVRDAAHLDRLPAAERDACRQLWADVEALLKKAKEKAK